MNVEIFGGIFNIKHAFTGYFKIIINPKSHYAPFSNNKIYTNCVKFNKFNKTLLGLLIRLYCIYVYISTLLRSNYL